MTTPPEIFSTSPNIPPALPRDVALCRAIQEAASTIQIVCPGAKMLPNLAVHVPKNGDIAIFEKTDSAVAFELMDAGIECQGFEMFRKSPNQTWNEVPTKWIGSLCMWGFNRAWHYWIAKGPGIPPDEAEKFHEKWGTQVRVGGHCMCPSPREWVCGFAVGEYHIDTQDGLNAFAELLRSIYIPDKGGST